MTRWCVFQVVAPFCLDVLISGSSFVMLPFSKKQVLGVFTVFFSVEVARTVRQQDFIDFSPAVVDFQFQLLSLYAKHHQDVPGNLQLVSDRTLLTSGSEES